MLFRTALTQTVFSLLVMLLLCSSAASAGTVTDIDGNVYQTVIIGTQEWMAENLKVTHYQNSDAIPNVTDNAAWATLTAGAYCEYNNDVNNVATYGRLYNWHAVADSRNIAPAGWRIPTDAEWKQLEMYLGMNQVQADATGWRGTDEGGKLKEAGATHWVSPNTGATNESGFSALPGGSRYSGGYIYLRVNTYLWSSTEYNSGYAWNRFLDCNHSQIYRSNNNRQLGFSVRCVRDAIDSDGDGIPDDIDNCPTVPNSDQLDTDNDVLGNACDFDDDNDGVADVTDTNPLNPNMCADADSDGCDDCAVGTDDFGPLADNLPNNDGADTDADGICNVGDNCPTIANPNQLDSDLDNLGDLCDNCPTVSNPDQLNTDSDVLGNACDPDDDNDGVPDVTDNDPLDPSNCADADADGCDDCAVGTDDFGPLADNLPANDGADTDADGICDAGDNCPLVSNPDQLDLDHDNIGDACDYTCGDASGDRAVDISDAVSLIAYIFSGGPAPNPLVAGDANCDGTVDISDAVYLIAYIFSGGTAPCAVCK